jgi:hypothetical protein
VAAKRLSVRATQDILRLKQVGGFTGRQIAISFGAARSAVARCLRRVRRLAPQQT